MKKILWLLLVVLSFLSCNKEEVEIPSKQAGRTILAYFWADNNLTSSLRNNIKDMITGLYEMPDSAAVVIYWDGASTDAYWPVPAILKYETNGRGGINGIAAEKMDTLISKNRTDELFRLATIEKTYPSQTSTDEAVMRQVISDMMDIRPSDSYGIILASHGSGWLPSITGTRSIGQDGGRNSTDTAFIPELAMALETANPQKFDFILFDACMMGDAEVYYELKDVASYCIASVLDVPAAGFPYQKIMSYFYKENLKEYFPSIGRTYIDTFNNNAWGTIAAVDCSQMEGLADATRNVILSAQSNLKNINTSKLQEYGRERFYNTNFVGIAYDMVQYIGALNGGEAPAEFMEQFNKTVLYADYTPSVAVSYYKIDGDNYCGMGMYIPNSSTSSKYLLWNNYFKSSIAWYQAAGWRDTETIWGK